MIVDEETGEPWFVAKDVAEALGFRDAEKMTRMLDDDDDEKGTRFVGTLRGLQKMTAINESGLYSLVLRSRKPEANTFKRWITHEVLPAIRKHGGYLTPAMTEQALLNPDTIIRLATALKEERLAKAALEANLTAAQKQNTILTAERAYIEAGRGLAGLS